MVLSKKTWIWIIVIAVLLLVIVIIAYLFRCKLFSGLSSCVEDPNITNTPVPPGSASTKWVPESDPYKIGMYGPKIKAMQSVLGITADGKFGNQTANAITSRGYTLPLSLQDYNTIIATSGGNASQNIAGAYAKYDNTIVRDKALNEVRKARKDEWLGKVTGTNDSGTYYELDGLYYVIKTSTYLKG